MLDYAWCTALISVYISLLCTIDVMLHPSISSSVNAVSWAMFFTLLAFGKVLATEVARISSKRCRSRSSLTFSNGESSDWLYFMMRRVAPQHSLQKQDSGQIPNAVKLRNESSHVVIRAWHLPPPLLL